MLSINGFQHNVLLILARLGHIRGNCDRIIPICIEEISPRRPVDGYCLFVCDLLDRPSAQYFFNSVSLSAIRGDCAGSIPFHIEEISSSSPIEGHQLFRI